MVLSYFAENVGSGYWNRFESIDAASKPVEAAQAVKRPLIPNLGRLDSLGGGFAKQCQDEKEKS